MSVAAIAPPQASTVPSQALRLKSSSSRVDRLAFAVVPALFAASCFAAGILLSHSLYVPPPVALLTALLSAAVAVLAGRVARRISLPPLVLAWILAGLFCAEIHPWADPQNAMLAHASTAAQSIQGEVVRAGPVRMVESTAPFAQHEIPERSQLVDLRVEAIGGSPVSGGLRLSIYATVNEPFRYLRCGDHLQLTAPIHAPERYHDPGVWDSTAYLLGQGSGARASAKAAAVSIEAGPTQASFACRLKAAQQAAGERIMDLVAPVIIGGAIEP
ncbi:MAG TPA: DUF4131 domain-containing protein, partial [Candidatus Binataceae bacterium]